jgi:serine/threonine protein kinase
MLDAVAYLHSKNITHRDLKPENVLFTDGVNIKISDFGLASMVDAQDAMKTLCGTPQYVAPEIIKVSSHARLF